MLELEVRILKCHEESDVDSGFARKYDVGHFPTLVFDIVVAFRVDVGLFFVAEGRAGWGGLKILLNMLFVFLSFSAGASTQVKEGSADLVRPGAGSGGRKAPERSVRAEADPREGSGVRR